MERREIRRKVVRVIGEMLSLDEADVNRKYNDLHRYGALHITPRHHNQWDDRYYCRHSGHVWSFVDNKGLTDYAARDTAKRKFLMWDRLSAEFKSMYDRDTARLILNELM